jgi:hypothetical protein
MERAAFRAPAAAIVVLTKCNLHCVSACGDQEPTTPERAIGGMDERTACLQVSKRFVRAIFSCELAKVLLPFDDM